MHTDAVAVHSSRPHYAVRQLMTEAADQAEIDPSRLSFTRTLNIVRRQVTAQAAFSPSHLN
jgi:hypothetical protein